MKALRGWHAAMSRGHRIDVRVIRDLALLKRSAITANRSYPT
jgi:hypothetical protein